MSERHSLLLLPSAEELSLAAATSVFWSENASEDVRDDECLGRGEKPLSMEELPLARAIDSAREERIVYVAGRKAYRAGESEAACPYPGSSVRGRLWLQGYRDDRDADEAKQARFASCFR